MSRLAFTPATLTVLSAQEIVLAGAWTARGIGHDFQRDGAITLPTPGPMIINAAGLEAMDSVGAWVLQKMVQHWQAAGFEIQLSKLPPAFSQLLAAAAEEMADQAAVALSPPTPAPTRLEKLVHEVTATIAQSLALLSFVGEVALAFAACLASPAHFRWRPVLYNIRSAGVDALPIVGLLSFLLGVVVAYQGADQLRQYGANIFVVDLVGLSMLREFAPLITAIIIAGRSGSAYAAQIGTMAVTEEIDAMRTIGIAPLELLVQPKIIALFIALPLLTVFADFLGVIGGMVMAKTQLGVGFSEFLERFTKAVSLTAYLVGVCKAPAIALIIAIVGCFQGFRTHGGADSVGRQTTRSVVQSIFLVIVADALFSVAFSVLDL